MTSTRNGSEPPIIAPPGVGVGRLAWPTDATKSWDASIDEVIGEERTAVATEAGEEQALRSTIARLRELNAALRDACALNERLVDDLRRQACEDGLTGLANRSHLDTVLAQEFGRARRFGRPLALVMCDIDHFKRVNDEYRHQTGDEVLRRVAAILRDHCRCVDTVGRFGGEEFVLVLPETRLGEAARIGERIRIAVEAYPWSALRPDLRVSVSMGVTDDLTVLYPERMLAAADAKLYEAKRAGRNRVCH